MKRSLRPVGFGNSKSSGRLCRGHLGWLCVDPNQPEIPAKNP